MQAIGRRRDSKEGEGDDGKHRPTRRAKQKADTRCSSEVAAKAGGKAPAPLEKEDVKREMKDMYGDPHVRGARDGLRREISEQDVKTRIKTARLVIIDIGVAIALHYDREVTPLPLIVAIGKAGMARAMVEIAQIESVPIISDARLVADLLEEGKLDQYIPTSTIDRVAQAMRSTSG